MYVKIALLFCATALLSCDKEPANPQKTDNGPDNVGEYFTGWMADKEDNTTVPLAPYFGFGADNLPTRHDLTEYFPPIQSQGQYGTCVSWAIGYNTKTAISAMDRKLSPADLAKPQNQFSPKDLFTSIPDAEKGDDCNGTGFEPALEILQSRGIARMSTVPYTNLGNCSQSSMQSSWTQDAANNKISYWRRIDPSANSIKQNISKNIPVILGAKLADNFMSWNSDAVLTSNTSFDNVGMHAYHAMAIVGYDDAKGPGGAFRVVNSWGEDWGDRGYIWVDYKFLLNEFCMDSGGKSLYIMANQEGDTPDDNPPDDVTPTSTGMDLATWIFGDQSTSGNSTERQVYMNIYNIGNAPAKAQDNWSVYYVYYNAYDLSDYGVIFHDEFTTAVARNSFECQTYDHCQFNIDLPSGGDFADVAFDDIAIFRTYNMPRLNGDYYLVLIADGDDVYQEDNELNNYFYTSFYPIRFQNGYALSRGKGKNQEAISDGFEFKNNLKPNLENLRKNDFNTGITSENPNAYTEKEVRQFLNIEKKSGRLEKKVREMPVENKNRVFSPQAAR